MKELSPAARDLLSLARNAGAPTAAARARVEGALLERLASPIAAGAMASKVTAGKLSAGAATGKAAAGVTSLTTKVLFVAGVSSAVVALGVALSTPSLAPNAVPLLQTPSVVNPPAVPRPAEMPTHSIVPAPESTLNLPAESRESKPHAVVSRSANRKPAVSGASEAGPRTRGPSSVSFPVERTERDPLAQPAKTSEAPRGEQNPLPSPQPSKVDSSRSNTTDQLGAEAQGLREIQRALRDGNGQTALELVANDSARFSSGVLHQERAAAKIQALCLLGRAEAARKEAESFEQRWPRSSLLARVRSACR